MLSASPSSSRRASPHSMPSGLESFGRRFWNADAGGLYDVVDADHVPGRLDSTLRPNQILAVGGLPYALLEGDAGSPGRRCRRARALDAARSPHAGAGRGRIPPRTRAAFANAMARTTRARSGPGCSGPFVEAWVRVRGSGDDVRSEARRRFFRPLLDHLDQAGVGHVSEIADAEPPHTPRGCPFQAWSVGEALRLDRLVLGAEERPQAARRRRAQPVTR